MPESRLSPDIAVVLYEPQDPVNIAATVRAMKNMGVTSLRLVRPCRLRSACGSRASRTTRGTSSIASSTSTTSTPPSPTACASSASRRGAAPRSGSILDPKEAAEDALGYAEDGRVGIVFGREDQRAAQRDPRSRARRGHIPTTDHASLNLAQAVLIALYELHLAAGDATRMLRGPRKEAPPPTTDLFERFFAELHQALDAIQFFKTRYPEHIMRSLRALTFRAAPDDRELSLLRAMALEVAPLPRAHRPRRAHASRRRLAAPAAPRHRARHARSRSDDAED